MQHYTMQDKKTIKEPVNEQGRAHGLWDMYCGVGNRLVVHFINGEMFGYSYIYHTTTDGVKHQLYYAR